MNIEKKLKVIIIPQQKKGWEAGELLKCTASDIGWEELQGDMLITDCFVDESEYWQAQQVLLVNGGAWLPRKEGDLGYSQVIGIADESNIVDERLFDKIIASHPRIGNTFPISKESLERIAMSKGKCTFNAEMRVYEQTDTIDSDYHILDDKLFIRGVVLLDTPDESMQNVDERQWLKENQEYNRTGYREEDDEDNEIEKDKMLTHHEWYSKMGDLNTAEGKAWLDNALDKGFMHVVAEYGEYCKNWQKKDMERKCDVLFQFVKRISDMHPDSNPIQYINDAIKVLNQWQTQK